MRLLSPYGRDIRQEDCVCVKRTGCSGISVDRPRKARQPVHGCLLVLPGRQGSAGAFLERLAGACYPACGQDRCCRRSAPAAHLQTSLPICSLNLRGPGICSALAVVDDKHIERAGAGAHLVVVVSDMLDHVDGAMVFPACGQHRCCRRWRRSRPCVASRAATPPTPPQCRSTGMLRQNRCGS